MPDFDMANLTFDNVVGRGQEALSQNQIRADMRALEDSSSQVRRFANKRIAHRTAPGELRRLPRFDELDDAMDTIDRLFWQVLPVADCIGKAVSICNSPIRLDGGPS